MSRASAQTGVGILELLIALVILSGLIGMLVIDQQLKLVVARQGDAVTRQTTEMAQLGRAASTHLPTLALATGARTTIGIDALITAGLLPADFGGGRASGIGRTPLAQTYRVEGRMVSSTAFEVLVWAEGEPDAGRLQRAAVPADAIGQARVGNAIAARLRDQFNLEAAYATRGTAALTAAQHALELALPPILGQATLPNNTVVLRVRSSNAISATSSGGAARCIAQTANACPVGWRRNGPWPACTGMNADGAFREMGVDLPEGRVRWRLDPARYTNPRNPASADYRSQPISEQATGGSYHPWTQGTGFYRLDRDVVLTLNGVDLLRTTCLSAEAPFGWVQRTVNLPPLGQSAVVCCQ
jgi:Tfp pilus assembly protein PilV